MHDPVEFAASLKRFSGRVALFPLPNVVLFPHALLPLHIFESRYRRMVADALDGEGSIAIAQFRPGWERLPAADVPAIYDTVCLGRIEAYERFPDGRYGLILQGLARAVVLGEEPGDLPYRVARVEVRADRPEPAGDVARDRLRRDVLETFRDAYRTDRLDRLFHEAAETSLPLGMVCDVVASLLSLSVEQSQELLDATDVERRCAILLGHLRALRQKARRRTPPRMFPPDFSVN